MLPMNKKHNAKWHLKNIFALENYSLSDVEAQLELIEKIRKYLRIKRIHILKEIKNSRDAL